ncbi:Uncharacterized protein FWK35_00030458, partial [Aphis craccivora]
VKIGIIIIELPQTNNIVSLYTVANNTWKRYTSHFELHVIDHKNNFLSDVLDSERSEECIDFTMMCVFFFFFVSVYSITSRNNAPISKYGGGFRCKSEYSWCIIEVKKKQKKNDGKTGIFTQNQFLTKSNFFYGCNSKTNH